MPATPDYNFYVFRKKIRARKKNKILLLNVSLDNCVEKIGTLAIKLLFVMPKKLINFWKPALWLALICYGLFLPAQKLPVKSFLHFPHFDKIIHFSLFFIFCLLLVRPFKQLHCKYYLWAAIVSISCSALLEAIQHTFSATRSSDFFDFLANFSGVIVALFFYRIFISGKKWEKLF